MKDVSGVYDGRTRGQGPGLRRALGGREASDPAREARPVGARGSKAAGRPGGAHGDPVRAEDGDPLGGAPAGDGLRLRHDMLAASGRVAQGRSVGGAAPSLARPIARGGQDRLVARGRGLLPRESGGSGGEKPGPAPSIGAGPAASTTFSWTPAGSRWRRSSRGATGTTSPSSSPSSMRLRRFAASPADRDAGPTGSTGTGPTAPGPIAGRCGSAG